MNTIGFFSQWRRNLFNARRLGIASEASEVPLVNQSTLPIANPKSKTWATSVTHVPSWPQTARPLKKHNWLTYLYSVADVILVLLPVYFILLGAAVINLNEKPTKDNAFGTKVEFAIQLGPTIFPIVFAAISGRSMKMYARYIAEKGANISTLELLMASQSVWGTVESQLLMQRLTLVGVNLLFLWALSPLGGQASLRLMKRDDFATYSTTKLRYMSTGPGATALCLASTYTDNGRFSDTSALYGAALLAPIATKTGPQDSWGNVKIPHLEGLNTNTSDPQGWFNVPDNISEPETWSSLVGLPVIGLSSEGTTDFNMEYTYLSVGCGNFTQTLYPRILDYMGAVETNWTALEELVPGFIWINKSNLTDENPFGSATRRASFFIELDSPWLHGQMYQGDKTAPGRLGGFFGNINQSRIEKDFQTSRELTYVSMYAPSVDAPSYGLNIAKCSLSQKHVEAVVRCEKHLCTTQKIRKSISDTRPASLTGLEHFLIAGELAREFPKAIYHTYGSSPTERFLTNSSAFPFVSQGGQPTQDVAYVNVSLTPPEVFSRRLSLVLNTYYQLSMAPTGYFGSLSNNQSEYGPDTQPVTDINAYLPSNLSATENSFSVWWNTFQNMVGNTTSPFTSPFIGATTTAKVTTVEEIFVYNIAWTALLFASSGIIFVTGAVGLILKRKTLGPEIFGFVTSMTYDNPYVRIGDGPLGGGTTMDSMERARLLKDVKVYIGDVQGEAEVGHIAMAAGVPLRKLERGRLYA